MEINKCLLVNNPCYQSGKIITPKGIVVHSTGANNPNLKRYVQPDDGVLGKNTNNNDWNRSGVNVCVHAFIGKDKNGKVRLYQTLPFNYRCWGCGKGSKGSYNDSYIQFEICEDALTDEKYFNEVFSLAIEFCNYLIKEYGISVNNVVSHHEAYIRGYASNHGDCDHWLKKFGKSMDWFRSQLGVTSATFTPLQITPINDSHPFKVRVTAGALNVRAGAGMSYKINKVVKKGDVYTIVQTLGNWGRLKSGAGWINLKYTKRC